MEAIEKAIRNILNEADISPFFFESFTELISDPKQNLTDILTQLRSIQGIVIVNVSEPSQRVSDRKEKTILRIKFLVPGGHSFNSFRKMLQAKARTLDGVQRLTIKQILDVSGKVVFAG